MTDAATYRPSMPIIRELARAYLGEPCEEPMARDTARRRGLMHRDRLTNTGEVVLARVEQQFKRHDGIRRG